jgi:hypothetical protein
VAKSRGNSVDFREPRLTTRSALCFSLSQLGHPAVLISHSLNQLLKFMSSDKLDKATNACESFGQQQSSAAIGSGSCLMRFGMQRRGPFGPSVSTQGARWRMHSARRRCDRPSDSNNGPTSELALRRGARPQRRTAADRPTRPSRALSAHRGCSIHHRSERRARSEPACSEADGATCALAYNRALPLPPYTVPKHARHTIRGWPTCSTTTVLERRGTR